MNNETFNLIMISAEMEHGGNLVHRHFDSHPNCYTYGFESQLGTKYSRNILCPFIHPVRYGYSEFPEGTDYERALTLIWDEECKAFLRNPQRSKFKDCGLIMDEKKRREAFMKFCSDKPFSRKIVVEGYFRSFFESWENLNHSGEETHYVGYNPGMVAETDKILSDFPNAHIIHVVRNPFSAYADYLKRPFPQQTLEEYCLAYNVAHSLACNYSRKYPNNFFIIRLEDFLFDKRKTLEPILQKIGLSWSDKCLFPSFNGKDLSECLPPWGTVEKPTMEYNINQFHSLDNLIKQKIATECALLVNTFSYLHE